MGRMHVKRALMMASAGRRYNMNTLATILASMRAPRCVQIHVRNHAEFMLTLMTLTPVWPGKVQS